MYIIGNNIFNILDYCEHVDNIKDLKCTFDSIVYRLNDQSSICGGGDYILKRLKKVERHPSTPSTPPDNTINKSNNEDKIIVKGFKWDYTLSITHLQRVKFISTGYNHLHFINDNNELYGMGNNLNGELGYSKLEWINQPVIINYFKQLNIDIVHISSGRDYTLFISNGDGLLYGCGSSQYGQSGSGNNNQLIKQINIKGLVSCSSGDYHNLLLDDKGKVYSFGWGLYHQLGHGEVMDCLSEPKQINSLDNECIVKVGCGTWHSLVLTSNGQVYSFGWNEFGQLGHGDTNSCPIPTLIDSIDDLTIIDISCGLNYSIVKDEYNRLLYFGYDHNSLNNINNNHTKSILKPSPILINNNKSTIIYSNPTTMSSFIW